MPIGVGMPAKLLLDEFANQVWAAFGHPPYLVGSALKGKNWRDIDVRLILSDADYELQGYGDPLHTHANAKWVAMTLAFSVLGYQITRLNVDFQIQQQSWANQRFPDEPRSALGLVALRRG